MAKNDKRVKVTLACEDCKRRNYITMKNKVNDRERIEMKKYCRWDSATPSTRRPARPTAVGPGGNLVGVPVGSQIDRIAPRRTGWTRPS